MPSAYSRAAQADPANAQAAAGVERVRAKLQPATTGLVVDAGLTYATNPRELPSSERGRGGRLISDGTQDIGLSLTDNRTIQGIRWRTLADAHVQIQDRAHELSFGTLSVISGPMFQLKQDLWLHVAPGLSAAALDNLFLYSDASLNATLSTLHDGLTQSLTARVAWRDVNHADIQGTSGIVVDVVGRLTAALNLVPGDIVFAMPHARFSEPMGGAPPGVRVPVIAAGGPGGNQLIGFTELHPFNDPVFIGDYTQAGGRLAYYFPILGSRVYLGAGVSYWHRWYDLNVIDAPGTKRRDDYLEPSAHLVFPDVLASAFDLRFDYRYEHNLSNDRVQGYENHVAGVRVVRRY